MNDQNDSKRTKNTYTTVDGKNTDKKGMKKDIATHMTKAGHPDLRWSPTFEFVVSDQGVQTEKPRVTKGAESDLRYEKDNPGRLNVSGTLCCWFLICCC